MNKSTLFAAGSLTLLLAGGLGIVWPSYRKVMSIEREIRELSARIDTAGDLAREAELLSEQVRESHALIDVTLRDIPLTPDVADLMRRLSLPVDGVHVRDQTFTAGAPTTPLPDPDEPIRAMPMTVDMTATFDSVFALLRAAESMDRLVRISTVRLLCKRADDSAGAGSNDGATAIGNPTAGDVDSPPVIAASIGLEAIYEPVDARHMEER